MGIQPDTLSYFRLKPIRAARVSEISETTAAAPVPNEERVNFHIGNPLQDSRLSSAFLRIALGIDVYRQDLVDTGLDAILEHLGWDPSEKPKLAILSRMIRASAPYMPRGGFTRKAPHPLVKTFCAWLEKQGEPLYYDTGEQSGRREIILASGGLQETLRTILFALSSYLESIPARILLYHIEALPQYMTIPGLQFDELAGDEHTALQQIEKYFEHTPDTPTFLFIGDLLDETSRRQLRRLSIAYPLFFIEANNAPNHLSLAREAKLVERVIRLLAPGIFAPRLDTLSTVFVAGNADFLQVIETIHFSLKGTPSASEVEFLNYLIEQKQAHQPTEPQAEIPREDLSFEGLGSGTSAETALPLLAQHLEHHLNRLLDDHVRVLSHSLTTLGEKNAILAQRIENTRREMIFDEFSTVEANELLDLLVKNVHDSAWCQALQRSFLSGFVKHQPQYKATACQVVSGSSRTALGILGFHCEITEVVIPDLSWSYEQCFPIIHAIPLTESLELDVEAMIEKVNQLCQRDPSWQKRGAVVINNPHNATGKIFDETAICKLILNCLQQGIYLIDDLAYQNVAPVDDLPQIKTARQIASDLVRTGSLTEEQAEKVITVHSMSKTDCLAGARLAVVEIRDLPLRQRFEAFSAHIQPNIAAIFICYLLYRSPLHAARTYWHMRNAIFRDRTAALLAAVENLPADRNPFGLEIIPPTGSMYPLLQVKRLPLGLSLDWLASSLARRGIGLLPLATFARTEKGFETGRSTFRLTLGGVDNAEVLLAKTRRLLIDMNRLVAEEEARYNRRQLTFHQPPAHRNTQGNGLPQSWNIFTQKLVAQAENNQSYRQSIIHSPLDITLLKDEFLQHYLPERLDIFRGRLFERAQILHELKRRALADHSGWLAERLGQEFMKDSLQRRQDLFKYRTHDRTVHPTQMYSLTTEIALDTIVTALAAHQEVSELHIKRAAQDLWGEFLGLNVSISSQQEADEILLDLTCLTAGEEYAGLFANRGITPFLSFWSDWDGSNRPSGQGHRLVAALVIENVRRMVRIFNRLRQAAPNLPVSSDLLSELEQLPYQDRRFTDLLNDITLLTDQLEHRYRGILPFSVESTPLQRLAARLKLRRDPARVLWQHNDRYERKMIELRQQRRMMLEYYFALNKKLRKQLHASIPEILDHLSSERLLHEVVSYRDILTRTVITPRIHQGLITNRDQFAIDTTVYNMYEINTIAGKYGNPGMALGMQISLSSRPEALILLDQKMRIQGEQMRRENPAVELPPIWLIPLYEDASAIKNICTYLDRVWDYATQSRQTAQTPQDRFSEIITEVFIAGSDISQQVGQAAGAFLYLKAKYELQSWLAKHGVAEIVRIKLGSGESMQRQGGYYAKVAGRPAFLETGENQRRFIANLPPAARRSTVYAITPLQGIFLGGDLRTFQSNLSEQLRYLPLQKMVNLLHHVQESQRIHRNDLIRAAETIVESRLGAQSRGEQELERLTIGTNDALYERFLDELTDNFRHILYGREDDVVGIHVISYFIARSLPQLRDRPTSRRTSGTGVGRGQQILANIAEIIPLAQQGSLLRAIAHNQAQTVILGISQLTTGLFRALERFAQSTSAGADHQRLISERILPRLPVYEILNTLRTYQDWNGVFLKRIETAFPAGNSAFVALREDSDAMRRYLPLFQQELLRRHGVNVSDFFNQGIFIPDLLPTLRPDLAVLLQRDLFNTDIDILLGGTSGRIENGWREEVELLLQLPQKINLWRSLIWDVIGDSIYQRVQSFSELAIGLYAFSSSRSFASPPGGIRSTKLSPALAGFFRTARADDEMRQFLIGTIEYLSSLAEGNIEVPVSIIRAMNDVERIAQIEESALPPEKQEIIRCCTLQIARLAGENG